MSEATVEKAGTKPASKQAAKKPAKRRARKAPAKKQSQIVKHDASKHKGNRTSSRPDLDVPSKDKALDQVREIRQANEERAATHNRVVVERDVETVSGSLNISTADGRVYITANKAVLDHDGAINAQHALQAAFQAVS